VESKWKIYKEFCRYGKLLYQQGLISITAGNISVRKGNNIYITSSGSMLGDLLQDEVVVVPIDGTRIYTGIDTKRPSVEVVVHKSIYENTSHKSVVHVHAPHTLAFSFENDMIELCDSEGKYYMPAVPVISVNGGIASEDVARAIPDVLNEYPAAVVRGHGIFAAADTLLKACSLVSTIEFSSKILFAKKLLDAQKVNF
jgi:L-fuculose-phosphate aldolase